MLIFKSISKRNSKSQPNLRKFFIYLLDINYFKDIYFVCNIKADNKVVTFGGPGLLTKEFCKKYLINVEKFLNDKNITDGENKMT